MVAGSCSSTELDKLPDGCGPLGIVTDIAALWTRFLTLESTSTERGVWWLLSVLSMATALPYLLFLLPTIGVILLRLELTGYDKRGTASLGSAPFSSILPLLGTNPPLKTHL